MNLSTATNQVYEQIQQQINSVVHSLHSLPHDDENYQELQKYIKEIEKLNREQVQPEYEQLKKVGEWDIFTIAFYGETNAGKSTLIEALRLFFKEKSKQEEQRNFQENKQKLIELNQSIENKQQQLDNLENQINQKKAESNDLENIIQNKKAQMNWFRRILLLISRLNEEKQLIQITQEITQKQKELSTQQKETEQYIQDISNTKQQLQDNLNKYSDGKIIGDGRSDFTTQNMQYYFDYNNKKFALIDVPGIEGSENKELKQEIKNAIDKAHAVFYVTDKPRVPQSGVGENQSRTLQKINEQLSAQTEVWSIYNPRITNSRALKSPLINEEISQSLNELDKRLSEELGKKHYQGHCVVSAYPAFLALASCLVDDKQREKFLENKTSEEILTLSGFTDFIHQLSTNIVGDENKIMRSNLNKALQILNFSIKELEIIQEQLDKSISKIEREMKHTMSTINYAKDKFIYKAENDSDNFIDEEIYQMRKKIYQEIDDDLDNDDFEYLCKKEIEERLPETIKQKFEKNIQKFSDEFQAEIQKNVDSYQRRVGEILTLHNESLNMQLSFSFNVESGIKWTDILGIVLGTVGLLSGQWWVIALSLTTFIKRIWDTVKSWFSSKKKNQKRATDETLSEAKSQLKNALTQKMKQIQQDIDDKLSEIESQLSSSITALKSNVDITCNAIHQLKGIQEEISPLI